MGSDKTGTTDFTWVFQNFGALDLTALKMAIYNSAHCT